ncbi:MAG: efflux RND transporter periplasmic adaptor subunit, partial [Bacteroidia bacterium]|nr:efflux RND transporter periplasmic adaptor subunit [Bacteroidia bacterium]
MKRIIITLLVVVGFTAFVIYKLRANKEIIDERSSAKEPDPPVAVTLAPVERRNLSHELTMLGSALADKELPVVSQTMGEIVELYFNLGDYKREGEPLAKVKDDKIRVGLEAAQAAYDKIANDVERLEKLFQSQATSEQSLRDAKLGLIQAKTQVDNLKLQLDDTKIVAPMSGIVTAKMVEKGSVLGGGTVLAMMADVSRLKVRLRAPEQDVYKLATGRAVKITADVYPGVEYTGVITFVGPVGDEAHTYPVEISLANRADAPLKAGTHVRVFFPSVVRENVVTIPREALIGSLKDAKVYVVENGRAVLKKIIVGAES